MSPLLMDTERDDILNAESVFRDLTWLDMFRAQSTVSGNVIDMFQKRAKRHLKTVRKVREHRDISDDERKKLVSDLQAIARLAKQRVDLLGALMGALADTGKVTSSDWKARRQYAELILAQAEAGESMDHIVKAAGRFNRGVALIMVTPAFVDILCRRPAGANESIQNGQHHEVNGHARSGATV